MLGSPETQILCVLATNWSMNYTNPMRPFLLLTTSYDLDGEILLVILRWVCTMWGIPFCCKGYKRNTCTPDVCSEFGFCITIFNISIILGWWHTRYESHRFQWRKRIDIYINFRSFSSMTRYYFTRSGYSTIEQPELWVELGRPYHLGCWETPLSPCKRIEFKILLLCFKVVHGMPVPAYLPTRRAWANHKIIASADITLACRRSKTSFGDRASSSCLCQSTSMRQVHYCFRHLLKPWLYSKVCHETLTGISRRRTTVALYYLFWRWNIRCLIHCRQQGNELWMLPQPNPSTFNKWSVPMTRRRILVLHYKPLKKYY
jgi:hypothetical protein